MRPVRTGRLHPTDEDVQTVDKRLVAQVLTKTCKIDAQALVDDNNASLETLYNRISAKIYGQNEAVKQVVEAVEMAKAGLQDDNKPLANLLFVGPTGVGKTEVARVLAKELGVSLVRFDMSEYTEKHTVAKAYRLTGRLCRLRGWRLAHRCHPQDTKLCVVARRDRKGT